MPLVRVDVDRALAERLGKQISDGIHQALVESLGMSPYEKFQIFQAHAPEELIFDSSYNGVDRQQLISIQILTVRLYDATAKNGMFNAIARRLRAIGIRQEDLLISVVENGFEDWFAGKTRT